eukprot:sb/3475800/
MIPIYDSNRVNSAADHQFIYDFDKTDQKPKSRSGEPLYESPTNFYTESHYEVPIGSRISSLQISKPDIEIELQKQSPIEMEEGPFEGLPSTLLGSHSRQILYERLPQPLTGPLPTMQLARWDH